jgi:protein-tyrosine phosphatase
MRATLLVVCHANLCRSPMAAALLAQRMPDWPVVSAGIAARDGEPADPRACDAMRAHGLDLAAHRARRLDAALCEQAALVLVMEHAQRRFIEQRFAFARGRVFGLGVALDAQGAARHFDIDDPYRGPRAGFDACAATIARAIDIWAGRIAALAAPVPPVMRPGMPSAEPPAMSPAVPPRSGAH